MTLTKVLFLVALLLVIVAAVFIVLLIVALVRKRKLGTSVGGCVISLVLAAEPSLCPSTVRAASIPISARKKVAFACRSCPGVHESTSTFCEARWTARQMTLGW